MNVDFFYQGKRDGNKLSVAQNLCRDLGIGLDEVAYIGDDINCVALISEVGFAACPSDAHVKVKNIPNVFVMTRKGGEGCVREFIDNYILEYLHNL